jgi:hypothetical protein
MRFQRKSRIRTAAIGVAALSLTSCAAVLQPGVSTIPGVGYSILAANDADFRRGLTIARSRLPREATYVPFRCSYRATVNVLGRGSNVTEPRVTVTRARDRLLFNITEGPNVSTALIGPSGHLFDFNLSGFLGGEHADAQTYGPQARATGESLGASRPLRVLNEFSMVFPEYSTPQPAPGDVVSVVMDQYDKEWGRYVYRGLTQYGGGEVALLDFMTTAGDMDAEVSTGFSLVDPASLAPVLLVFNAGSSLRLERVSCS